MSRPRGRPPGPADLRRSANRFRRVIADALGFVLGLNPYPAAAAGAAIDIADFTIFSVRGEARFAVPQRLDGGREETLIGAAGTIARRGARPPLDCPAEQLIWHTKSGGYFWAALSCAATGNAQGEEATVGELGKLDAAWPEVWRRFIGGVVSAPLRLDLTARDADPLPKRISGILKAVSRRRGRDVDKIFRAQTAARRSHKSRSKRKSPAR